mmetsp:Transcript_2049/g.3986  ORF Transcript_2049/g.3986 Transcript_2049/m.3986 type:complete len:292 (+) Transcript_2049:887-1762(+)
MNTINPINHLSSSNALSGNTGANNSDIIVIILMRISSDGPDVSLNGSPIVSPTTVASCSLEPLPVLSFQSPLSIHFLALSQAPPALAMKMASIKPDTKAPMRSPPNASRPNTKPHTNGEQMANTPGIIISMREALVEIATHSAKSGLRKGTASNSLNSRNCRRTSSIIRLAARPTANIVSALNTYGKHAPQTAAISTSALDTSMASTSASALYAANNANVASTAEPIQKPLPVAAVVLPRASKPSVISRTSFGNSAISAIPPALSATGPNASVDSVMPSVDNIPTAAIPIP